MFKHKVTLDGVPLNERQSALLRIAIRNLRDTFAAIQPEYRSVETHEDIAYIVTLDLLLNVPEDAKGTVEVDCTCNLCRDRRKRFANAPANLVEQENRTHIYHGFKYIEVRRYSQMFQCPTCHAIVYENSIERHQLWHWHNNR